jgi:hypothetical protein
MTGKKTFSEDIAMGFHCFLVSHLMTHSAERTGGAIPFFGDYKIIRYDESVIYGEQLAVGGGEKLENFCCN